MLQDGTRNSGELMQTFSSTALCQYCITEGTKRKRGSMSRERKYECRKKPTEFQHVYVALVTQFLKISIPGDMPHESN